MNRKKLLISVPVFYAVMASIFVPIIYCLSVPNPLDTFLSWYNSLTITGRIFLYAAGLIIIKSWQLFIKFWNAHE